MKYTQKLLEDKIVYNTDYEFLNSIKDRFPTNNPYFLVCLTEIIFNHEEDDTKDVLNELGSLTSAIVYVVTLTFFNV